MAKFDMYAENYTSPVRRPPTRDLVRGKRPIAPFVLGVALWTLLATFVGYVVLAL
ncbi:hypothetical protein [Phenylobacterium sp.]|uniref:hypothetical protein n=1 Tax=Phenylobacterium sp. TaxID=1871053 RepID=UPI00273694F6|nr:hypothetical protein [Phenylobacterium sp.]MDP3660503.1 hypothetical protein [Phenylobacterium sp.]